jgi:hypothetical protein
VHLADFGIARLVDSAHQTRTGDVLGTPAYFAPEQVAGEPVGPPADIYALGIVLIECLSGRRPFEGTAMEVAMARLARAPEIPADLSADWRALLTAMTARAPEGRPAATQVADALRRIADGQPIEHTVAMTPTLATGATTVLPPVAAATQIVETVPPAPVAASRRRGPTAVVVVIALLVAVAVAVAVVVATRGNNGGSGNTAVHHGQPTLRQPLERDLRRLEDLVHP